MSSAVHGLSNDKGSVWKPTEYCPSPKRSCGSYSSSIHCSSPVTERPSPLSSYLISSPSPNLTWSQKNYCKQKAAARNNSLNEWSSIMPTPPDSPPPTFLQNNGFLTDSTTKLGLRNLLKVPTSNSENYFLTRRCSYIFYCCRLKVDFNYPKIANQNIVQDNRVQEAIERMVNDELEESTLSATSDSRVYSNFVSRQIKKAIYTLNDMKASLSSSLIRLTGYVLFKVFNYLFMSVTITEGQLQMIDAASKRKVPLIFVPLHRSHVDYLFVTWILFNREVPAPIVAAGENLRMPVFGCLLRGLGGFFIKRRLESNKTRKDLIYRSLLQTYMTQSLKAGFNLEFFIEGGRTRTGKPCLPKGGLLSVIVDAYLNGTLDDALIVPIAINYDKLLDGNFIQEQLGQNKVPESFWRAVRAIVKVLSTSFGHSRIDFSQPFSLKEFFQASKLFLPRNAPYPQENNLTPPSEFAEGLKGHCRSISTASSVCSNKTGGGAFHETRSSSSLFGTEVTEDYRQFVKSLASHIVYDAEKCQAIMSTNAISWLISFQFRDGTYLSTLTEALTKLREDLTVRKRDTGFSGSSLDVTIHALNMLGSSLIHIKGDLSADDPSTVFIRPVTALPNIIELNYYANALAPLYSVDSIVATSLVTVADCDLWSYQDVDKEYALPVSKLLDRSKRLCEILKHEFMFVPPCGQLDTKIHEAIDRLSISGLLINPDDNKPQTYRRSKYDRSYSDEDSDESGVGVDVYYSLAPKASNLESLAIYTRSLSYLIDSYYATVLNLKSLINKPTSEKEFIHDTQKLITIMLRRGTLLYGESIAADPIRNAIKVLENEGVIESYTQDNIKLVYLSKKRDSEEKLLPVLKEIESFRV